MKRTMSRLLTIGISIVALAFFAGSVLAQGNDNGVGYRVFWPDVPSGDERPSARDLKRWVDSADVEQLVAVGFYDPVGGLRSGFIYDYNGLIDPNQTDKFWDVTEIAGQIPAWVPYTNVQSIVYSFNKSGRFAGIFLNADNTEETIPFYFDLDDAVIEFKQVPIPAYAVGGGRMGLHLQVNEIGDILIAFKNGVVDPTTAYEAFIYNPDGNGGTGEHIRLLDSDGSPFQLRPQPGFNSQRVVAGRRLSGDSIVRFPVGGGASQYDEFAGDYLSGLNESSEFACRVEVQIRRRRFESRAAKIGQSLLWTAPVASYPKDLNNAGDLLMEYGAVEGGDYHLLHEGDPAMVGDEQLLNIRSMLIAGNYSPPAFEDPMFGLGISKITDRDSATEFPWIAGQTAIDTDSDGNNINAWFFLIPEVPGQSPGISVAPSTGLVTTEAGGTDFFDVVLNTEPSADVTIGISSSKADEGTVDQSSLTFTPDNWDTPQTVTITGVDDAIEDGDMAYTIFTAPANSNDPDYNGLDADDVSVTNEDDELPPGGGSETYDATDIPPVGLEIPDNNLGVATSNILAGDHLITNLTVNIDITHQRPADLEVYLVGPDGGPPVQLFNFSGDNVLADFNGESSLGQWTLEVYDTRKKREGTLNSWSITVDY